MALTFPNLAVTDFTQLPDQIIIDLINFSNGTSIPDGSLSFGLPTALPEGSTHNTTIIASAVPGVSLYEGDATLTYNRVDLSTVPGARETRFIIGSATTIADLIPAINAAYQLNLQPEDFINAALPALIQHISDEEEAFELIAGPNSLIFVNRVALSVYRPDIPLSSVIVNTALNGLIYRQPEELV
jgi:hypothetical protein